MTNYVAEHKTAKANPLNIGDQIKDNETPNRFMFIIRIQNDFAYVGPCQGSTIGETRILLKRIFTDDMVRKRNWSLIKNIDK